MRCSFGSLEKGETTKYKWAPIRLSDEYHQSVFAPYDFIHGKYSGSSWCQSLYTQYDDDVQGSIFRSVDRILLMISIFESTSKENPVGSRLNIAKMTDKKACLASFAIHDYDSLKLLADKWLIAAQMPMDQVSAMHNASLFIFFPCLSDCLPDPPFTAF